MRVAPRERVARAWRRLRPLALNLLLVGFSTGVAALVAEVAVRVVAPQQLITIRPDLWQPADTVGWLHRPDVDTWINMGERTVSVFTDADGFRVGPDGPAPTRELEVLLIGDSFMEALQVEHEQSGAGLLEAALPSLVGAPVGVRNAGIGGWDPDQYLLRARSLLGQRDFDLVITAVYLGNDVIARRRDYLPPRTPAERARLRLPRRPTWAELTDAILRPVNDALEVRSHLFVMIKNHLRTVRMKLGLYPLDLPSVFLTSERDGEQWEITADLCEEIAELASLHGAPTLFVLIPAPYQVDAAEFMEYVLGYDLDTSTIDLEQPNHRLGEALAARGLLVHDLLGPFRAAHDGGEQLYGRVDPHFTPEGNRLFARIVAPLAAELLAPGPTDPPEGG